MNTRTPESLAREAMRLYWQVKSHGTAALVPQRNPVQTENDLLSIAQEIFLKLSKRKQNEVLKRCKELQELPTRRYPRTYAPDIARPEGVPETLYLMYLSIATQEEHLRLNVVCPVPWQLLKATYSEGLVIHQDFPELSPWSAKEFGERLMGWKASKHTDWPERNARSMIRTACRRIGRELFRHTQEP